MIEEMSLPELVEEHRKLDIEIEKAIAHPGVDEMHVAELKKRKLGLKDQIAIVKAGTSKVA
jgi:hypothetical protein